MTSGGSGAFGPSRGSRVPNSQAGSAYSLGPAPDIDAAALALTAAVTPVDVGTARALWHSLAPPRLADLLDAQPVD